MDFLSAEKLLNNKDSAPETHPQYIQELGGYVGIKELSGEERSDVEGRYVKLRNSQDQTKKICALVLEYTLSDKEGNRLFNSETVEKFMVKTKGWIVESLFQAACEINRLREEDIEAEAKN